MSAPPGGDAAPRADPGIVRGPPARACGALGGRVEPPSGSVIEPGPGARRQSSPRYALRTVSLTMRSCESPDEDDLTRLEDVAAVRDRQRLERVLLDEQDRHPLAR